ncbi:MAG: ParB/RepB/Spo0J family partition protein [Clostridia bacterium]|nr:ParB/RepB/Spo0J family partition protein [Clostridia bacterium]MBQ8862887.1 ParB/RepB/Spo0J family partition protein [Clostridia bacterium]
MAKSKKMGGLGRGLDAILTDNMEETKENGGVTVVRLTEVEPNPDQPRKNFDTEPLEALAESISQHGIIQPIVVRPKDGMYMIVTGERRWRAARMAGLSEVPVIIIEADDRKAAELALVENIQRKDLNPVEEARAYADLIDEYNYTQEEIAKKVGRSRSSIANSLRLLDLPDAVLAKLAEGAISEGHAKVLLSIKDKEALEKAAETVVAKELSVRETEKLVKALNEAPKPEVRVVYDVDHTKILEQKVQSIIGHTVKIVQNGKKSSISIGFSDNDDLEKILVLLCGDKFNDEL